MGITVEYLEELLNIITSLRKTDINRYIAYEIIYVQEALKNDDIYQDYVKPLRDFSNEMTIGRDRKITDEVKRLWALRGLNVPDIVTPVYINKLNRQRNDLLYFSMSTEFILGMIVFFIIATSDNNKAFAPGFGFVLPLAYFTSILLSYKSFSKTWHAEFNKFDIGLYTKYDEDYLRALARKELGDDTRPCKSDRQIGISTVLAMLIRTFVVWFFFVVFWMIFKELSPGFGRGIFITLIVVIVLIVEAIGGICLYTYARGSSNDDSGE